MRKHSFAPPSRAPAVQARERSERPRGGARSHAQAREWVALGEWGGPSMASTASTAPAWTAGSTRGRWGEGREKENWARGVVLAADWARARARRRSRARGLESGAGTASVAGTGIGVGLGRGLGLRVGRGHGGRSQARPIP